MCVVELQKMRHDTTELLIRAIQPALWLLVFGETFTRLRAIPTGNVPYLDYLAPGILAQSALFVAIFYGIQIIWDRDAGVLPVTGFVVLGSAFFCCLSITVAGLVVNRERVMGIGQAITMPCSSPRMPCTRPASSSISPCCFCPRSQ